MTSSSFDAAVLYSPGKPLFDKTIDRRDNAGVSQAFLGQGEGFLGCFDLGISDFVFRFCYITPLRRNNLFSKQLLDTLVFCFGPNIHSLGLFDAAFC